MGNKTSKPEAGSDTKNEEDIVQELIKNLENIKNKDIPTVLEKLKKVKGKISSEGESKEGSQPKVEETPKGDNPPAPSASTTGPPAPSASTTGPPAPSASTTGPLPAPGASTTGPLPTPAVDPTKKGGTKKRSKKRDTMSDFKRTRSIRLV